MCRTGGRRCEHSWNSSQREAVNAQRRARYASAKGSPVRTYTKRSSVESAPTAVGLTENQAEFFKDTVAVNPDGSLITVYHGSAQQFEAFDSETLGRGNDSWGNGFYFTDQRGVAEGYAVDSGSPEANVKDFYIDMKNPIMVDGKEAMSLVDYRFTNQEAIELLKRHPDIYLQPDEDDERSSLLSDYSEEYWDRESHTPEQFEKMIKDVAGQHFQDTGWVELENLYGRDNGQAWLKAVNDLTGHDGVIVDFGDDGKHYVAWFPEQMKLTKNQNPDNSNKF